MDALQRWVCGSSLEKMMQARQEAGLRIDNVPDLKSRLFWSRVARAALSFCYVGMALVIVLTTYSTIDAIRRMTQQ